MLSLIIMNSIHSAYITPCCVSLCSEGVVTGCGSVANSPEVLTSRTRNDFRGFHSTVLFRSLFLFLQKINMSEMNAVPWGFPWLNGNRMRKFYIKDDNFLVHQDNIMHTFCWSYFHIQVFPGEENVGASDPNDENPSRWRKWISGGARRGGAIASQWRQHGRNWKSIELYCKIVRLVGGA